MSDNMKGRPRIIRSPEEEDEFRRKRNERRNLRLKQRRENDPIFRDSVRLYQREYKQKKAEEFRLLKKRFELLDQN